MSGPKRTKSKLGTYITYKVPGFGQKGFVRLGVGYFKELGCFGALFGMAAFGFGSSSQSVAQVFSPANDQICTHRGFDHFRSFELGSDGLKYCKAGERRQGKSGFTIERVSTGKYGGNNLLFGKSCLRSSHRLSHISDPNLTLCATSAVTEPDQGGSNEELAIRGWTCSVGVRLSSNVRMGLFHTVTVDGSGNGIPYDIRPRQFQVYLDNKAGDKIYANASWTIDENSNDLPLTPDSLTFSIEGSPIPDGMIVLKSRGSGEIEINIANENVRFVPSSPGSIWITLDDEKLLSLITQSDHWQAWNLKGDGLQVSLGEVSLFRWSSIPLFYTALENEMESKRENFANKCQPFYYPEVTDESIVIN